MALPVTISSTQFPDQNYFEGPFIDGNGNVYIVLLNSTTQDLEVYKATDPTDSFSEVDAAGAPTAGSSGASVWVIQDGDTLHIIAINLGGGVSVRYHTFTTSDHATTGDEWVVANELVEAPGASSADGERSCSIVARSDGTVVVIYNGDEDSVHGNPYSRVDYAIRSTVPAWTVGIALDAGGQVDYFGSVAVLDTDNDMTHFFFIDFTASPKLGKHRSLTSGDSLSIVETGAATPTGDQHPFIPGIFTLDGSTHRVRVAYRHSSGGALNLVRVDDDGTPSETAGITAAVFGINESPVACLAVDGTHGHVLYSDNTSDLFHDTAVTPHTSWGTDTEFKNTATINRLSCNVIDRSGKKLAMVYDDDGTVQYDEKDIGSAPATRRIFHIN